MLPNEDKRMKEEYTPYFDNVFEREKINVYHKNVIDELLNIIEIEEQKLYNSIQADFIPSYIKYKLYPVQDSTIIIPRFLKSK